MLFLSHAAAQECVEPPDNLVSWWPGDGNARDIQGANDGTLQNGATFAAGKVEQGFSFNGVNQFVEVPDSPDWDFGTNDFTIDLWVNFSQINATNAFVAHDDGPGAFNKWIFWLRNGQLEFHTNDTVSNLIFIGIPFSPDLNTWYHVAVTRNGEAYNLYINGSSPGPITNSTAVPNASASLTLGMAEGGYFLNGRLDEMEIFNRALSTEEIQALYNADSAGKCRTCVPPPADMVSWYQAEGGAADSQDGNDGTLQNGVGFAAGKVGQGFSFDGVDDFVEIPEAANLNFGPTSPMTVDAWVFRTGSSPVMHILGKREGCGGDGIQYQLAFDPTFGLAFGGNGGAVATFQQLPLHTWTHLAATFDGDDSDGVSYRFYINGLQVATGTGTLEPTISAPLKIGAAGTCGGTFEGLIDEVEIFERALSAEEIANIANAGSAGKCTDTDEDGSSIPQDCNDHNADIYPGAAELCNGVDDDCDEIVDEGFADVGASCTVGTGACQRTGAEVCTGDGQGTECDVDPGTPGTEECNNIDDDCDGETDETAPLQPLSQSCYSGPSETRDVGSCRSGAQTCSGGTFGSCVGEVIPTTEVCDELDNDCDGQSDEGGVCPPPPVHDLAVLSIDVPTSVTLTAKKPVQTQQVTVQVQNRSPHAETVQSLNGLVTLTVDSLGGCTDPAPVLHVGSPQPKLPRTLAAKQTLNVVFDVTFNCANDAAKGRGHEDYRYSAGVNHAALDGQGDTHTADDICPRSALGLDPNPDGKIKDKGCEEELTDIVIK